MFTIHIYFNFVLQDTNDSIQARIDVLQSYQLLFLHSPVKLLAVKEA